MTNTKKNTAAAVEQLKAKLASMSIKQLADLYNATVPPTRRITKFRDKTTGVDRCFAAVCAYNDRSNLPYGIGEIFKATETTQPKTTATGKKRGLKSKFANKIIKAKHTDNHRRKNSWGYHSFNIILAAGDKGLTYEEFLSKGGRNNDIVWDYNHGYVELAD